MKTVTIELKSPGSL